MGIGTIGSPSEQLANFAQQHIRSTQAPNVIDVKKTTEFIVRQAENQEKVKKTLFGPAYRTDFSSALQLGDFNGNKPKVSEPALYHGTRGLPKFGMFALMPNRISFPPAVERLGPSAIKTELMHGVKPSNGFAPDLNALISKQARVAVHEILNTVRPTGFIDYQNLGVVTKNTGSLDTFMSANEEGKAVDHLLLQKAA